MVAPRIAGLHRKQRRELARRLRVADPGLEVMHPNPAGIDVGDSVHYVPVRPNATPILSGGLSASRPIFIGSPIGYSSVR